MKYLLSAQSGGFIAMELLLLALAGLGGLALLLQQKALPSREDAEKAFEVLDKNPIDPDANTVFGKYKAFVMGDYDGAMPYLVHSKDTTLKTLAEHELDDTYIATPTQKVVMGDEWVAAGKKFPALSRIFYDRATQWYVKAWPNIDGVPKQKLRAQGAKIAASRPPGAPRKGFPAGWEEDKGLAGILPVIENQIARTGSYSMKIPGPTDKGAGAYSTLKSQVYPITGKKLNATAYVLTDGTTNPTDKVSVWFYDEGGNFMVFDIKSSVLSMDTPLWSRHTITADVPEKARSARFVTQVFSKTGNVWVDDVSMKIDDKEILKNGTFD